MADLIIGMILLFVVGIAVRYIVKAKKSGVKCIGCPASGTCGKKACGCTGQTDVK